MFRLTGALALAFLGLAFAFPADARAGFVATFTFTGLPGNEAGVPVDAQPPDALLTNIVRGPGLTPNLGLNSINSRGWTTATSLDPADYYQFIITPSGAVPLALTELDFTARRSLAEGPTGVEVRASTDNFASSFPVALFALSPASDANFRETIGLTGFAALQDVTMPVTFRIFAFGSGGGNGTFRLGIDAGSANRDLPANLVLSGHAVPEPASVVMVGCGGLALVVVARLRRRAA